jgi:ATPase family associated with various cellular activities (AAA)
MVSKQNQNVSFLQVSLANHSSDKSNKQPFPKFTQTTWRKTKTAITFKAVLTGLALVGGGGCFTTLAYVQWVASGDESKIKEKFTLPITMTVDLDDYFPRNDVEASLKKILNNPSTTVSNYWVIVGEHGTGKTTTVQKVCNEIGKGIIYVDVPEDLSEFGKDFAQAIGVYYHQQNVGPLSYIHKSVLGPEQGIELMLIPVLSWDVVYGIFKEYADWYRKENNKAPVIVIDNINRLANDAPKILQILQDGAKDAVGSGLFTAVFVISDGSALSQVGGI